MVRGSLNNELLMIAFYLISLSSISTYAAATKRMAWRHLVSNLVITKFCNDYFVVGNFHFYKALEDRGDVTVSKESHVVCSFKC